MADKIEIDMVVEAVAKGFEKVTGDIKKTEKAGDTAKTGLAKYGKQLDEVVRNLTGFSLAQVSAAAVITKGIAEVKKMVSETVEYANVVRKTSTALGITAEETSRVIQVFDDYGISVSQVETALSMAAKNGFAPSIENLAQLSDRILAMEDPTKRAAELNKIFGRSWADVSEILYQGGAAIRDQAAAVSDGLIMTDEAIKAAREYELALDDWNDAVMGVKVSIGNELIPILTRLIGVDRLLNTANDDLTGSYSDYRKRINDIIRSTGQMLDAQGNLIDETGGVIKQTEYLTRAQFEGVKRGKEMNEMLKEQMLQAGSTAGGIGIYNDEIDRANRYLDMNSKNMLTNIQKQKEAEAAQEKLNQQLADALLKGGMAGTLQDAWDRYNDSLGGTAEEAEEARGALERTTKELIFQHAIVGLNSDAQLRLAQSLGLISEMDYQAITATQQLNLAMDPNKPAAYEDAILFLNSALADGKLTAEEMKAALDLLDGKTVTSYIRVIKTGEGVPGQMQGADERYYYASGTDTIVNRPTTIVAGEQGAERVTVSPVNTYNYNYSINTTAGGSTLLTYDKLTRGRQ